MDCPYCQSDEISDSGVCLVCGRQVTAANPASISDSAEKDSENFPGMIETDYAKAAVKPSEKEELPQWRKELSQRLQEIKQKKEAIAATEKQTGNKSASIPVAQSQATERPDAETMKLVERPIARKAAQMPRKPPPRQKPLQLVNPESSDLQTSSKPTDKKEIEKLIDNAVSRQAMATHIPVPVREAPGPAPRQFRDSEGKLIFLSRTLSGLIDLICIVLFVGIFIIAADRFGGILVLDAVSLTDFAALFLLTYFVYSLFFLIASSQTVGMMIADLRVIGIIRMRPSLQQLLKRCFWFLVSLLVFGIGLLWGLFDRDNLCLHDRFSGTRVIRS
jgi:uncharacterized RDD family membrane protein YckC